MIEDYITWYIGIVGWGTQNYRGAKYNSDTSNTLISVQTNAKVGLLRLGELLSAQQDYANNITDYWLLTRITGVTTNVYAIRISGYLGSYAIDELYGIRPFMNLKANIIITGGEGTKENPFYITLQ